MLLNGAYFLVGLVALYLGAEWLVRGAARLARARGVSTLVVGLTVVAFGSSAPELVVGAVAAVRDQSDVVLGNVVGSNILNIALILGISALVRPLAVEMRLLSREVPLMVAVTLMLLVLALDRLLSRVDAVLLLVGFCGYLYFMMKAAQGESHRVAVEFEEYEEATLAVADGSPLSNALLLAAGIAGLVVGAQLLLTSAVFFARLLGVTELVIGLTIVALGTSLPELATCGVAAWRGESDIAMGNAVGSNIFNILSILGVSAMIRPIRVSADLFEFEFPAMILFSALLVPLAWRGRRLGRYSGAVLVLGYVVFTWLLVLRVRMGFTDGL